MMRPFDHSTIKTQLAIARTLVKTTAGGTAVGACMRGQRKNDKTMTNLALPSLQIAGAKCYSHVIEDGQSERTFAARTTMIHKKDSR